MRFGTVTLATMSALSLAGSSCSSPWPSADPDYERRSSEPGTAPVNPDEVAVVRLSFTVVPDPVKCVSVAAVSGGATKSKNVDVTPGTKPAGGNSDGSFDLGRFAPGPATFSAKGYDVDCASVTSSVVPSWFSKGQAINIVAGPPITLTINLQRVQSPDVTVNFELTPVKIFGTEPATMALLEDGTAKLWGVDVSDLNPATNVHLVPTTMPGLSKVAQVVGDAMHNCALLKDGTVRCWGQGFQGALGDGDGSKHMVAAPGNLVAGLTGVVELAARTDSITGTTGHTCAALNTGEVKCWGSNSNGAIGQPSTVAFSATPVKVQIFAFGGVVPTTDHICAGREFTCSLDNQARVTCWGKNDVGQLGHAPIAAGTLAYVNDVGAATSLDCGGNGACAVGADGSLTCWGQIFGDPLPAPTKLEPSGVQQVAIANVPGAFNSACLRKTNGQVICWGWNGEGQLGDGSATNRATRDVVTIAAGATDLSVGNSHACAIADGRTLCWGWGVFVGYGSTTERSVPTAVKW
jgi:alpha-tubulin suppressor-like RCC1 family protein